MVVQILPGLHILLAVFLRSARLQVLEERIDCLHCYSQCRYRIYNTVVTQLFELVYMDVGGLTELGHVRQQINTRFVLL